MGMRSQRTAEVTAYLAAVLETRTTAAWLALFDTADIPAMAVATPEQVINDPHLAAVGFLRHIEHPVEGPIRTFGVPSTWSRSQPDIRREAPLKGEHSAEVLAECGLDQSAIQALFETAVSFDGRRVAKD